MIIKDIKDRASKRPSLWELGAGGRGGGKGLISKGPSLLGAELSIH